MCIGLLYGFCLSLLSSAMLDQNPGGVVLSTDDYFTRNGQYHYELNLLGEAHEWNHQRGELYTRPSQYRLNVWFAITNITISLVYCLTACDL